MENTRTVKHVPFFRPSIGKKEIEAVIKILHFKHLTMGIETRKFEEEFKHYIGARYAIGVDSCTNGLFLALKYNQVGAKDVIRMPSLTFSSVASVVLQAGAEIQFEDEFYVGQAYRLKTNRPFQIVDAAHQIEWGVYKDFNDSLMCFSFYPTKNLSSCEGGMICLNDHYAMEWLEKARWHGRKGGGFNYSIEFPGWKFNMTDIQAAIGRVQLRKIDWMNRQRKHLVNYYNRELNEHGKSIHLYRINVENRDEFIAFMDGRGINCSVHFFTPLHKQPAFKRDVSLPKTEQEAKTTVSLPLYPDMTKEEADVVIQAVKEWRNG